MWDTKACIVCLSMDCRLYRLNFGGLMNEYCEAAGCIAGQLDGMPNYLCYKCAGYVKLFTKFRAKCKRAQNAMKGLLQRNIPVTEVTIKTIDREVYQVAPNITLFNFKNISYEMVTHPETFSHTYKPFCITDDNTMPVIYLGTELTEPLFDTSRKIQKSIPDEIKEETVDEIEVNPLNNQQSTEFEIDVPVEFKYKDEKVVVEELKADNDCESNDDDFMASDNDDDASEDDNKKESEKVEAKNLDEEEYATVVPISVKEAKAVMAVNASAHNLSLHCDICGKGYQTEARLKNHQRIHDTHTCGTFKCEVCYAYYKTQFLLDTHLKEKHQFKYLCKKCPEVNFDRVTAKQHYIRIHLWANYRHKDADWRKKRPKWLSTKGLKRENVVKKEKKRQWPKPPKDYPKLIPVSHNDQYKSVEERKLTRNYIESKYKCDMCYKGFLTSVTFEKHLKAHDPAISGKHQCDMCKIYFKDQRKCYAHIRKTHMLKYVCQLCDYVCSSGNQARLHYHEHKNVIYPCQHCNEEFKKMSTLLTHVRMKHPSTSLCAVCGHSFVSDYGVHVHMNRTHSPQEIEESKALKPINGHPNYCAECKVQFLSAAAYVTHLGSSNKHSVINVSSKPDRKGMRVSTDPNKRKRGRPKTDVNIVNMGIRTSTTCDICDAVFPNDVVARRHYESEHPGTQFLKRYMCDMCGHTTKQHANLLNHLRTHTKEKPFACPHCDKRFTNQSNRDTHLVVHTGERKHACQHCGKRFSRASCLRLHIQTVHLKIPYPPWDKKNRRRRKEMEAIHSVDHMQLDQFVGNR